MKPVLKQQARQLRLSGLLQTLEVRLQEARSHDLTHEEFLENCPSFSEGKARFLAEKFVRTQQKSRIPPLQIGGE